MNFQLIKNNKKYFLSYFLSMIILSIVLYVPTNHIKFNIAIILLVTVIGTFLIYISLLKDIPIHRIALLIIILFGILTLFLSPLYIAHDEVEHFIRSDLTSDGVLIPQHNEKYNGFLINKYTVEDMNFNTFRSSPELLKGPVHDSKVYAQNVFPQNMFYIYIGQGLGIFLAKFLELGLFFIFWFGRLGNLLIYAIICAFAIKKSDKFKIPLLFTSCLPIAIFQASSMSGDGLIFALSILAISTFIQMYSTDSKIKKSDYIIFIVCCLLIGLIKIPYGLLIFLILILPQNKFNSTKERLLIKIVCLILFGLMCLISAKYLHPLTFYTGRASYYLENNVNSTAQLSFILHNPFNFFLIFVQSLILSIPNVFILQMSFFHGVYSTDLLIVNIIIFVVAILFVFFYPIKVKIAKLDKIFIFLLSFLLFGSFFVVQYLNWTPVGFGSILGIIGRYFLPMFLLLPMFLNINYKKEIKNLDNIVIISVIILLSALILLLNFMFYV